MIHAQTAHLPPGRRSRLARLTERGHGRMAILMAGPPTSRAQPNASHTHGAHQPFLLAAEARLSAITAPLGLADAYLTEYADVLPLILDLNPLHPALTDPTERPLTATIDDALRLNAQAVHYTLTPTPTPRHDLERLQHLRAHAHHYELPLLLTIPASPDQPPAAHQAARTALELGADLVQLQLPHPPALATTTSPEPSTATGGSRTPANSCAPPAPPSRSPCSLQRAPTNPTAIESAQRQALLALDAGFAGFTLAPTIWRRAYPQALHAARTLTALLQCDPALRTEDAP